ncbi:MULTISPECIES: hypothetical protein [unclassified Acidovorax]|uniref:hypothetical protein n=1 Tax=unclassified Acidovorax TaxID=2684926 RepID=UPI0028834C1D|nr:MULTISPECIES: hypothetical protein [unclassified Acidovorax]
MSHHGPTASKAAPPLTTFHITLAALWLGFSLIALATSRAMAQPQHPSEGRRGPPPEAFTACEGKAEGATVDVRLPDGKSRPATCVPTASGRLAARPAGGPPPGEPGLRPPAQ